jgi:hypothetical protein
MVMHCMKLSTYAVRLAGYVIQSLAAAVRTQMPWPTCLMRLIVSFASSM